MHTREYVVSEDWVDINKHMGDRHYIALLMKLGDEINLEIGFDEVDLHPMGYAMFTGDFHITYLRELLLGDRFLVESRLAEYDTKRWVLHHEVVDPDGALSATASRLFLNIDWRTRRATDFPPDILEILRKNAVKAEALSEARNLGRGTSIAAGRPEK